MRLAADRFRLLRATAVTAVVLSLAMAAHIGAGGTLPPTMIMVALVALTMLPVLLLTARKRSTAALIAVLGGGQFVLHRAFEAFAAPVGCVGAPAAHVHHVAHLSMSCAGSGAHQMAGAGGLLMLAAHILATIGTSVVLARGEAAFWTMAAWLRPLVRLPVVPAPATVPAAPLPGRRPVAAPHWRSLRLPSLRGPPVVAHAA